MRLSHVLAGGIVVGVLAACSVNPFEGSNRDKDPTTVFHPVDAGVVDQADGAPVEDVRDHLLEKLPDALQGLPTGGAQLTSVCGRGKTDAVTRGLCGNPPITSLKGLQGALGLNFVRTTGSTAANGQGGNPAFALLGHSSSLVARDVSAVNPRAFVFSSPAGRGKVPGFVVTAFARGENFVEIAAHDATKDVVDFYLVKYELPCSAGHTCKPGDVLTPAGESGWVSWTLYDDEDLKNTILDCRHCHNLGAGTPMGLRMQEFKDPWTHWMRNDRPGGIALFVDYLKAHGDQEEYGGIPATLVQKADGLAMEDLVNGNGFSTQPNQFDTKTIEREVTLSASGQPNLNDPPGSSSTWQTLYNRAVTGEMIPPPYHDVKITDSDKLAFATDAYQRFRFGQMSAADLPDIRRVFLDRGLPDMTIRPKVGATGREILVQMCAQCHNPKLDQSITRARFDATKIDTMTEAQKQTAITRMRLPSTELGHMPPAFMRAIPDDQLELAITDLGH